MARLLVEALSGLAESRGVSLRLAGEASCRGEEFLLERALRNLLANALDFAPEGSEIRVDLRTENGHAVVEVSDRGPGVPDYARSKVFERFYSLPRPNGGRKSSGLGLPFVREVARLHGGSAELRDREGGGTISRLVI